MNTQNRKHFKISNSAPGHKTQNTNISNVMVLLFWLFHVFAITNWSLDNFNRFNTLLLLSSDLLFPSLCTLWLKPNFSFYLDSYCVILIFKQLLQYSMHFYFLFFSGYFVSLYEMYKSFDLHFEIRIY